MLKANILLYSVLLLLLLLFGFCQSTTQLWLTVMLGTEFETFSDSGMKDLCIIIMLLSQPYFVQFS